MLSAVSWLVPNLDFTQDDDSNATNKAAFVDGTWHLTDRLNLTAGIRYTKEDKDYTFRHLSFVPGVPSLVPPTRTEVSYSRNNPRAVIDYRWTPTLMIYVSYATGFRAGGFNGRPFNATQVFPFGPETLDTYRTGHQERMAGPAVARQSRRISQRLRGCAGFYSDHRPYGQAFLRTGQPRSFTHHGRGDRAGGRADRSVDVVSIVGLNQVTVTELGAAVDCAAVDNPVPTPAPDANCTFGGATLGRALPFVPEKTASAAIVYEFRLPGGGSITPAVHLAYQSEVFTDVIAYTRDDNSLANAGGRSHRVAIRVLAVVGRTFRNQPHQQGILHQQDQQRCGAWSSDSRVGRANGP